MTFLCALIVAVVIAAVGDYSSYNCNTSPASIVDIVVVGGVHEDGFVLPWSNFGECINFRAPGKFVVPDTGSVLIGSSVASALITGAAGILRDFILKEFPHVTAENFGKAIFKIMRNGSAVVDAQSKVMHRAVHVPCTLRLATHTDLMELFNNFRVILDVQMSPVQRHFERIRNRYMNSRKHD